MSFKDKINDFRRKLMKSITQFIGKTKIPSQQTPLIKEDIKRIFVCRPNHRLGNLLLITPLIQELEATFPNCKIDLLVKGGVSPIIFKNYTSVEKYIPLPRKPFKNLSGYFGKLASIRHQRYDLAINAVPDSSSGKIFTRLTRAKHRIFGDLILKDSYDEADVLHIAKFPVLSLRFYLSKVGIPDNGHPIPTLNLKLGEGELEKGKKAVYDMVINQKKTMSIFTFATGDKLYPKDWWTVFYDALLKEFPNYNIIEILPVENVSQIDFKAPSLYSKDVREMAAIMKSTSLFIGADSGIMHLAVASGVPTVGLFSVTNIEKYAPYGKSNSTINTRDENIEEWMAIIRDNLNNR